jgi:phospholipid transport system substrate-binding protein
LKIFTLTALSAALIFGPMADAQSIVQPIDAIRDPINNVVKILEDPAYRDTGKRDEQREKIRAATWDMFDFTLIAKRATGRFHWENSFTDAQRQEFTDLFAKFLSNTYLNRISGNYENLEVDYLGQEVDAQRGLATVKTRVHRKGGDLSINYSMRLSEGRWQIYDVFVEGVSLVQNYQTQFRSLLENETGAQLIERLKKKIEEQKQQGESAG